MMSYVCHCYHIQQRPGAGAVLFLCEMQNKMQMHAAPFLISIHKHPPERDFSCEELIGVSIEWLVIVCGKLWWVRDMLSFVHRAEALAELTVVPGTRQNPDLSPFQRQNLWTNGSAFTLYWFVGFCLSSFPSGSPCKRSSLVTWDRRPPLDSSS